MSKQRSKFSEFLHQRRGVLKRRWKQILSDAYMSRSTLHRIRHGDPYDPIAEVDSLRALANALKFKSWPELVEAFDKGNLHAGLGPGNGVSFSARRGSNALTGADSTALTARPSTEDTGDAAPDEVQEEPLREDAVITLSKALNLPPTELVRRLTVKPEEPMLPPPRAVGLEPSPYAGLPSGLRMEFMRPARMAPKFSSGVAASKLVEKLEDEDAEEKQPVDTEDVRVFTIPVDGDCQDPVWKNGEVVVFSFDAVEREGIQSGKSYYLAFTDGSTTFKRVFLDENDPDAYILQCYNTIRYPQRRRVPCSEVVRIARAISKMVSPED